MQETHNTEHKGFEGGKYARTEDELYKKALTLLEKCKIETQGADQESPKVSLNWSP